MRYQIYEAKSVKHDAQQRVGVITTTPETRINTGFSGFLYACGYTKGTRSTSRALCTKGIQLVHNLLIFVRIQMGVNFKCGLNVLMPEPLTDIENRDFHLDQQAGVAMPLRYNNDKRKKP